MSPRTRILIAFLIGMMCAWGIQIWLTPAVQPIEEMWVFPSPSENHKGELSEPRHWKV